MSLPFAACQGAKIKDEYIQLGKTAKYEKQGQLDELRKEFEEAKEKFEAAKSTIAPLPSHCFHSLFSCCVFALCPAPRALSLFRSFRSFGSFRVFSASDEVRFRLLLFVCFTAERKEEEVAKETAIREAKEKAEAEKKAAGQSHLSPCLSVSLCVCRFLVWGCRVSRLAFSAHRSVALVYWIVVFARLFACTL